MPSPISSANASPRSRSTRFPRSTALAAPIAAALALALGASCSAVTPGSGNEAEHEAVASSKQALSTHTWESGSVFKSQSGGYFDTTYDQRVFVGDVTGDGVADIVGVADDGAVWVSVGSGTAFQSSSAPWMAAATSGAFAPANGWFDATSWDRVWLADVTGDGMADLVGIDPATGNVWVAASTGSGFTNPQNAASTGFVAPDYFGRSQQHRIFIANVDGDPDGKADILGIAPNGDIQVALATGSGTTASFAWYPVFTPSLASTGWTYGSTFNPNADWFNGTSQPRVWVGDVTGDGKADIVGIALNGDLYVSESYGAGFNTSHRVGPTVLVTSDGWFSTSSRPRIWLADVDGDGKKDLVGIAPTAVGDGDVWAELSTGSGATAASTERLLLNGSIFKTAYDWFLTTDPQRIWIDDVTGDGRADIVGVANDGGVWVAKSAVARSSDGAPAGADDALNHFLPSTLLAYSSFTQSAGFFGGSIHPRLWLADVTGDGVKDLVGIWGSADTHDGDILWHMPVPATVTSMTPLTKGMVTSGAARDVTLTFSRSIAQGSATASALTVAETTSATDGGTPTITPSLGTVAPKQATWSVPFGAAESTDDATVTVSLAGVMDKWGQPLDGDGDLIEGGTFSRTRWWRQGLVAGVTSGSNKVDLTPPSSMTGLPISSGYTYCETLGGYSALDANPLTARVVVIAGGGACATTDDCRAGQACVAGQCQAGGEDANQPLVIVNADLVGVNTARLAALLAGRFGLPSENLIFAATHDHAAVRNIRLFTAPYYDDRDRAYESWVEDRIADGVATAMLDMAPVKLSVGTGSAPATLSVNRRYGSLPAPTDVNVIKLTKTDGTVRAMLVNYALHPVYEDLSNNTSADFPGFMAQSLETDSDGHGHPAEVALFINAGAGDINPPETDYPTAQSAGEALAQAARGATMAGPPDTSGMAISVERRISAFSKGASACRVYCDADAARETLAATWEVPATAVSIGLPSQPTLRFGTLPGEPFSSLQVRLEQGVTAGPRPLLFGYTNGYLGYLADDDAAGDNSHVFDGYSVDDCVGPVYFHNHDIHDAGEHTPGVVMVDQLLGALCADGSCASSYATLLSVTDDSAGPSGWCNTNGDPSCMSDLSAEDGQTVQWIACSEGYAYNTPTDLTYAVPGGFTNAELFLTTSASGYNATATVSCVAADGTQLAMIEPSRWFQPEATSYQWSVPTSCIWSDKVTIRIARTGGNCLGPDFIGLSVH